MKLTRMARAEANVLPTRVGASLAARLPTEDERRTVAKESLTGIGSVLTHGGG